MYVERMIFGNFHHLSESSAIGHESFPRNFGGTNLRNFDGNGPNNTKIGAAKALAYFAGYKKAEIYPRTAMVHHGVMWL